MLLFRARATDTTELVFAWGGVKKRLDINSTRVSEIGYESGMIILGRSELPGLYSVTLQRGSQLASGTACSGTPTSIPTGR